MIDQENWDEVFKEHFFDARKHGPKKGQIMASYKAIAEFVDGQMKRDIIKLLQMNKAKGAAQVIEKLGGAKIPDCYRVCREMAEDLLIGMSEDEVAAKSYKYKLEHLFYVEPEYVPRSDPHWETIELIFDPKQVMDEINRVYDKTEEEEHI